MTIIIVADKKWQFTFEHNWNKSLPISVKWECVG